MQIITSLVLSSSSDHSSDLDTGWLVGCILRMILWILSHPSEGRGVYFPKKCIFEKCISQKCIWDNLVGEELVEPHFSGPILS